MNGGRPEPMDASRVPVLRQRLALDLEGVTLKQAITAISRQSGLVIWYSDDVLRRDTPVHLRADAITVAAALTDVLMDAGVDVVFSRDGTASLVSRTATAAPALAGTISGRVTDAGTQQGVEGVRVFLEGTRSSATTTSTGSYRLTGVAAGAYTLATRRLGYREFKRAVTVEDGREVTVDVALQPVPSALDEVVVTVTGEQRLLELGHVVGRVNADSVVKEAPVSSLSELLTARVPGLVVSQYQGTVGGRVSLQIRGANSLLLNTEPIVVIDGVRYTNSTVPSVNCSYPFCTGPWSAEATSPLNDLNPNNIENIEVVKGPSAATLYGTDASNGVIVITTKRGRPGPARWNMYVRGTTNDIPKPQYPDTWYGWGTQFGVPNTVFCYLQAVAQRWCPRQDSVTVVPNPLNRPEFSMFGHAPRWESGLSVAGGRPELRYSFSAAYEDATGPIKTPDVMLEELEAGLGTAVPDHFRQPNTLDRLNLRASVAAMGERAEVSVNSGYIHSNTRSLQFGSQANPFVSGFASPTPDQPYGKSGSPAQVFAQKSEEETDRFVASINAQWRPAGWLTTRATAGVDLGTRYRAGLLPRDAAPSIQFKGAVQDDRFRQLTTTGDLGATVTARPSRLSSRTSVGAQYVRTLTDGLVARGVDLPPGGSSIGEAAQSRTVQIYTETVTLGSYLEETLGLNDRLFLTGAFRVDGASAFGRNYDATVYPKLSASWLLSEEPFLPRLPGVDEVRLRYAYGASGQQPLPTWARPQFSPQVAVVDGAATTVLQPVSLGNPDIKPERVREHEGGVDVTALSQRLHVGVTWYRRRTVDQIVSMPQGPGLGSIYTNLGLTTQHGFEAEIAAQVFTGRLVSWDLQFQHGLHRTKLVDLGGAAPLLLIQGGWAEGYPLGSRFAPPLLGYTDQNSDGIIAVTEVQWGPEPVYIGESAPPISQTLTSVLGLMDRRVRISGLLERRTGFVVPNEIARSRCNNGRCRERVDPTTPLDQQARAVVSGAKHTFFEPGDFTRLREVTIAADLPERLVRALRRRSATMSLAARNLALWTDYSGPDPESPGISIPQSRSWTLRLDLGF